MGSLQDAARKDPDLVLVSAEADIVPTHRLATKRASCAQKVRQFINNIDKHLAKVAASSSLLNCIIKTWPENVQNARILFFGSTIRRV